MATDSTDKASSAIFDLGPLDPGDIVFVYAGSDRLLRKIVRYLNVTGQRILAAFRTQHQIPFGTVLPKYSHVMLGLGSGLIVHADGKKVSIEIISDALRYGTDQASRFQVYRRRNLAPEQGAEIARAAVRFYNKKYRFSPFFTATGKPDEDPSKAEDADSTQFCSRLVAHSYRSVGAPVSDLPDQKTLPVDLYRICQSADWVEVTSEFERKPIPAGVDQIMADIDIPGLPKTTMSEFFEQSDRALLEAAVVQRNFFELQYRTTKNQIEAEATLAQFCSLLFTRSKELLLHPERVEDADVERVGRILEQLEGLLSFAFMPSLDALVALQTAGPAGGKADFVGFATPAAIQELRRLREKIRIFTYLLFAEFGLMSIVAYTCPNEKNKRFQGIKRDYVSTFFVKLQRVQDLTIYEGTNLFPWVDDEDDRTICLDRLHNILGALGVIQIIDSSIATKQAGST